MHWILNYFKKMSMHCSIGFVATSFASMRKSANKCWCLGKRNQTSVLPIKIAGDALEVVNERVLAFGSQAVSAGTGM